MVETILIVCLVILLLFLLICFSMTYLIERSVFKRRYDDNKTLKFFTAADFEGLNAQEFSFKNEKGSNLKGMYYYASKSQKINSLVVLVHGLGPGHLQYTTEINDLASQSYGVVAFDIRGCNLSEGKGLESFASATKDLNCCLSFLRTKTNLPIVLFGHSMGGHAVIDILFERTDLAGVISLAPFYSIPRILTSQIVDRTSKAMWILYPFIYIFEFLTQGKRGVRNAKNILKKTATDVLIVQGKEDPTVTILEHLGKVKKEISSNSKIQIEIIEGRYHRPNITKAAAEYDLKTHRDYQELKIKYQTIPENIKKDYYENLDYHQLVEIDPEVNKMIKEFLIKVFHK